MKIDREALVEQLGRLKPAVERGGVPEMGMFWFDSTQVSAYNGEMGIRMKLDSGLQRGVPGAILLPLLANGSAKDVTLEPDSGTALKVQCGRSRNVLPTAPIERNPWPKSYGTPPKGTPSLTLTKTMLAALRRSLLISLTAEPSKAEHQGIMVEAVNGGAGFYATDSRALTQLIVDTPLPKEFVHTLLLREFVTLMLRHCAEDDKLYRLKDCFCAVGDGITLYGNLLGTDDVTDLSKVAAKYAGNGSRATLPEGLGESLDNARILGGTGATIKFSVKDRAATIKGSFPNGQLNHQLALKERMPAVSAELGVTHLRAVLDEAQTFGLTEDAITLHGGDDFLFIMASAD